MHRNIYNINYATSHNLSLAASILSMPLLNILSVWSVKSYKSDTTIQKFYLTINPKHFSNHLVKIDCHDIHCTTMQALLFIHVYVITRNPDYDGV